MGFRVLGFRPYRVKGCRVPFGVSLRVTVGLTVELPLPKGSKVPI